MSTDVDHVKRIGAMGKDELLQELLDNPEYLVDTYYAMFGDAIRNRAEQLLKVGVECSVGPTPGEAAILCADDIAVSVYRADWQPPRGGWSTDIDKGITVLHKPTGLCASCGEHKSPHRNRTEAEKLLVEKVQAAMPRGHRQHTWVVGTGVFHQNGLQRLITVRRDRQCLAAGDWPGIRQAVGEINHTGTVNCVFYVGLLTEQEADAWVRD